MDTYAAIEDHGLIGDLQTAALVTSDGTIDWFCAPRFDSPSIFAALLDRRRGGYFRIAPDGTDFVTKQLYLPGTSILITRFLSADGVGEVIDFMPIAGDQATDRHRLVRMVRVVRGRMRFRIDCQPRFNYGRDGHETEVTSGRGGVPQPRPDDHRCNAARRNGRLIAERGHAARRATACGPSRRWPRATSAAWCSRRRRTDRRGRCRPTRCSRMFEQTRDFWRGWIGRSRYRGRWREAVERSAMTLKLLTYAPTGALVAAPTAGLPEQIGGERNWDYRYTWVRDGSFSVHALLGLGFVDEAQAFMRWLKDRIQEAGERGTPLQIMYRIDGSSDLDEEILDPPRGLPGLGPGAGRQRRRGPTPARHLRRGAGLRPPGRHPRRRDVARGLAPHRRPRRLAVRRTGTSRRTASGRRAAAGRTSPTAG